MKLTEYAVKNAQFTLVVFFCLAALGVSAFLAIPRMEDPDLKVPSFNIVTVFPGANAPEQVLVQSP